MHDCVVLKSGELVGPLLPAIVEIGDRHSSELGFLPYAAYSELALKNQLWAIADGSSESGIAAFLTFGGNSSAIKIIQLYVSPQHRRARLGSQLIDELKEHARLTQRQVIAARVATDLPANAFWERHGFFVIRQVPGGKASGRTINVRVFDVPTSSLLVESGDGDAYDWLHSFPDKVPTYVPTYALDLNVIFDVLLGRPDKDFISKIFSSAFSGEIRLCVSPELANEIQRASRETTSDPLLRLAVSIPVLQQFPETQVHTLVAELRVLIFPSRRLDRRSAQNDESDLRHLAACILGQVGSFVTRERAIIRAANQLRERFGLEVLSPEDVVSLSGMTRTWEFQPTQVRVGSLLSTREYDAADRGEVETLCRELCVDTGSIRDFFEASTSAMRRVRFVVILGSRLVGFASHAIPKGVGTALRSLVLLQEGIVSAQLAVESLLGGLLAEIPRHRLVTCELLTSESQLLTRNTTLRCGFIGRFSDHQSLHVQHKQAFGGVVSLDQWNSFSQQLKSRTGVLMAHTFPAFEEASATGLLLRRSGAISMRSMDLLAFEATLSPLILLASDRPAAIVPIREQQANELLPEIRVQEPLFEKEACAHYERAYLCRSSYKPISGRGTLVIFYVSGAAGGRGEAVGVARICTSGIRSVNALGPLLLGQAVLAPEDLTASSAVPPKEISYFTFDSFHKFQKPVSYARMKDLGCVGPANLVSIQTLEYAALVELLTEAEVIGES